MGSVEFSEVISKTGRTGSRRASKQVERDKRKGGQAGGRQAAGSRVGGANLRHAADKLQAVGQARIQAGSRKDANSRTGAHSGQAAYKLQAVGKACAHSRQQTSYR